MRFDNLVGWLDWQTSLNPRDIELGLERVRLVWDRLGAPALGGSVITVAGTNGKGSTARIISSLLVAAGLSVGTYGSPHLQRINERFTWNQREIDDDDLAAQIDLEADNYVPYPLEEVNLDFEVLGPSEKNPDTVDVLLAACRSENVDLRSAAVETGGLSTHIMDVESFASENAFALLADQLPDQGMERTIAVIDVGATMTTLNVVHNLKSVYTRDTVFGGKQLTEEIMRRYGLSYEEAGMAKRQGGLPENYLTDVLEPFKEALVQQASRSLQFFYSSSPHSKVDHIVLAGGSASIPGMDEMLQEKLGVETTIANPFASMSLSARVKPQTLSNDAPALLIACGLALRSFD